MLGFSLLEVIIALAITTTLVLSVDLALTKLHHQVALTHQVNQSVFS
jgi:prepilin-type N-terminal cleavage/methylation domain-containing protein